MLGYFIGYIFNYDILTIFFGSILMFVFPGCLLISDYLNDNSNSLWVLFSIVLSMFAFLCASLILAYYHQLNKTLSVSFFLITTMILFLFNVYLNRTKMILVNNMKKKHIRSHYKGIIVVSFVSICIWYFIYLNTNIGLIPSQDIYDYILRVRYFIQNKGSYYFYGSDFYPYSFTIFHTFLFQIWNINPVKGFIILPLISLIMSSISTYCYIYAKIKDYNTAILASILLLGINGYGYIHSSIHPYNSTITSIVINLFFTIILLRNMFTKNIYIYSFIMIATIIILLYPYIIIIYIYITLILSIKTVKKSNKSYFKIFSKKIYIKYAYITLFIIYITTMLISNNIFNAISIYQLKPILINNKLIILWESYGIISFLSLAGILISLYKKQYIEELIIIFSIFITYLIPLPRFHRVEEYGRIFLLLFSSITISFLIRHQIYNRTITLIIPKYKKKIEIKLLSIQKIFLVFALISICLVALYPNYLWVNGYKGFGTYRPFNSITQDEVTMSIELDKRIPNDAIILTDPYTAKIIKVITGRQTSRYSLDNSRKSGFLYNNTLSEITYAVLSSNITNILTSEMSGNKQYYLVISTRTLEWYRRAQFYQRANDPAWKQLEIQSPQGPMLKDPFHNMPLYLNTTSTRTYKLGSLVKTAISVFTNPKESYIKNYMNGFDNITSTEVPFNIKGKKDFLEPIKWFGFVLESEKTFNFSQYDYLKISIKEKSLESIPWIRIWFRRGEEYMFWNFRDIKLKRGQTTDIIIILATPNYSTTNNIFEDVSRIEILYNGMSLAGNKIVLEITEISFFYWNS
ncbi:hypothetical protein AN643_01670 [Candidatus Epulonipiscioides saccharophilum]|nr:hypothetical protein AN643_01670 [Epulopiscium sp. SCG-B10WGA-EpuloB]